MTGYVLPPSPAPKKRFHDGREPELPTFIRYSERPLRSVPDQQANTPSSRTREMLSLVLDETRGTPPLRYIGDGNRWLTGRRAAFASVAVVIYLAGFGYGYVVARRAAVVEAEVRAAR